MSTPEAPSTQDIPETPAVQREIVEQMIADQIAQGILTEKQAKKLSLIPENLPDTDAWLKANAERDQLLKDLTVRGLVDQKEARQFLRDDPVSAADVLRFIDLDDRYYAILETFMDPSNIDELYKELICDNNGFIVSPDGVQRLEAYVDAYTSLKQEVDAGRVDFPTCSKIIRKSPDEIYTWISENRRVMATVDRYVQAGFITKKDLEYSMIPYENPQEALRKLKEKATFNIKMQESRDRARADRLLARLAELDQPEG